MTPRRSELSLQPASPLVADLAAEGSAVQKGGLVDAFDLGERSEVRLDHRLLDTRRQFYRHFAVELLSLLKRAQLEDSALNTLALEEESDDVRIRTVD